MRETIRYRCTACGTVTLRIYPAGGAPPVLDDECEGCQQFSSEHRRMLAIPPPAPA